jgi:hypothetical protein
MMMYGSTKVQDGYWDQTNQKEAIINGILSQALGEDWDAPGKMMEVKEALINHGDVIFLLWPQDPTPRILQRVLNFVNYGSYVSDDDKIKTK